MILVQRTTEMEKLNFGSTPKRRLGRFIEPFGDMVQHGWRAVL